MPTITGKPAVGNGKVPDGFVARVGKGRRRLEGDPGSPVAEGEVGRMVELQWGGYVEARARIYHPSRPVYARTRVAHGGDVTPQKHSLACPLLPITAP